MSLNREDIEKIGFIASNYGGFILASTPEKHLGYRYWISDGLYFNSNKMKECPPPECLGIGNMETMLKICGPLNTLEELKETILKPLV